MHANTSRPTTPAVWHARRNAEARLALASQFGLLSSAEIAERAGSQAKSWKQEGQIFSVSCRGEDSFPGYQFDGKGKPLPVIARVLAVVGSKWRGWELALWFVSSTGWLNGRSPVELLHSEPDEVVQAAEREMEDLFF